MTNSKVLKAVAALCMVLLAAGVFCGAAAAAETPAMGAHYFTADGYKELLAPGYVLAPGYAQTIEFHFLPEGDHAELIEAVAYARQAEYTGIEDIRAENKAVRKEAGTIADEIMAKAGAKDKDAVNKLDDLKDADVYLKLDDLKAKAEDISVVTLAAVRDELKNAVEDKLAEEQSSKKAEVGEEEAGEEEAKLDELKANVMNNHYLSSGAIITPPQCTAEGTDEFHSEVHFEVKDVDGVKTEVRNEIRDAIEDKLANLKDAMDKTDWGDRVEIKLEGREAELKLDKLKLAVADEIVAKLAELKADEAKLALPSPEAVANASLELKQIAKFYTDGDYAESHVERADTMANDGLNNGVTGHYPGGGLIITPTH